MVPRGSRWRRILVALFAGVSVALVLAYLTLVIDDKPLFGVNPDVQLWIGGGSPRASSRATASTSSSSGGRPSR
jgi:hypothetical protein